MPLYFQWDWNTYSTTLTSRGDVGWNHGKQIPTTLQRYLGIKEYPIAGDNMNRFIANLSPLLIFLTISSVAFGFGQRCVSFYDIAQKPLNVAEILAEDALYKKINSTNEMVVAAESYLPGNHGGQLIKIRRKSGQKRWDSNFSSLPDGQVGSPRDFAIIAGEKLAWYFGFRKIGDDRMTIPDMDEVNGGIERLNAVLKKHKRNKSLINFQFYRPEVFPNDADARLDVLKNSKHGRVPYGHLGIKMIDGLDTVALHDTNIHLARILYPSSVIDHGYNINARTAQFVEYLRAEIEKLPESPFIHSRIDFIEQILYLRDRLTDVLDANSVYVSSLYYRRPGVHLLDGRGIDYVRAFNNEGESADSYIYNRVYAMEKLMNPEKYKQFWKIVRSFFARYPEAKSTEHYFNSRTGPGYSIRNIGGSFPGHLYEQMVTKHRDLEWAAEMVMTGQGH